MFDDDTPVILRTTEKIFAAYDLPISALSHRRAPSFDIVEIRPRLGCKIPSLLKMDRELSTFLEIDGVNIFGPHSGKYYIEIPRLDREFVNLKDLFGKVEVDLSKGRLPIVLGKDKNNKVTTCFLEELPHLLICGATGSGKSVAAHTVIQSLTYYYPDIQLVLIDPKRVEFSEYEEKNNVSVVTEVDLAFDMLDRVVSHMDRIYRQLKEKGLKSVYETKEYGSIVVVIDELADLMLVSKGSVEEKIVRIAQLGRAAGIHLVLGTQRPDAKTLTGLIRSNVPGRLVCRVNTKMDSRIAMDRGGGEKLLGKGDALFWNPKNVEPIRLQVASP